MRWLESQVAELRPRGPLRVLDIGCGVKPYYPLFAPIASEYVGVDVVETEWADVVGPAEAIPVDDGSFDLVLCTQVLEHTDDPAQTVRELRRVLAPGGRALASTHGVQWYHPSPNDHWRWTHTGLRLLFERNGDWSALAVAPAAGSGSTLAMLLANYTEAALRRTPVAGVFVSLIHRTGAALDAGVPRLRELRPGALVANLHVVADAAP
jgi:ubiquinone/menaquinone biosynthesis C-methylase UbiE